MAGCESEAATAEGAHGDIWLFERGLGELADWYPPPAAEPLWSLPLVLDSEQEGFTPPILVGDPNGRPSMPCGQGRMIPAYITHSGMAAAGRRPRQC